MFVPSYQENSQGRGFTTLREQTSRGTAPRAPSTRTGSELLKRVVHLAAICSPLRVAGIGETRKKTQEPSARSPDTV